MATRKQSPRSRPRKLSRSSEQAPALSARDSAKALPKPKVRGGAGRVDVTGIMPEDVHIDADVTEGHPGYQESGSSEIIPNERLTQTSGRQKRRATR